uniref:Uncharacterized protein n=1 Tax=Palpitomonas bilix TaxID=652834 RepID=A0A7S3D3V9_9EUKA|mmetsp:Transcript_20026/g.51103  ORF Transcript_20026/g.51103 Transcript_20026/m.51103 type:complete len:236 (+) Transcript_20026:3-710(+)
MKGKEVEEVVEGGGVGGGFKLTDEQEKVVEEVLAKEYGEEEPCSEAERGEKPEESKVNICVPLGDGYLPTDEEVERISDIDKQLDRFFKVREQGRGTLAGGEEEVLFSCRSSVSAEMDGSHSRYAPITTARSNREDAQHFEKIMRKTNITVGGKVDFLRQIRLEKEERERLEKVSKVQRNACLCDTYTFRLSALLLVALLVGVGCCFFLPHTTFSAFLQPLLSHRRSTPACAKLQ